MTDVSTYKIPLQPGVPQTFAATLDGVTYTLTLLYRNDPSGGWVLDIADANGNPILGGIPLVTGVNLLEQYAHLGFVGGLYVQTTSDPDAVPTFENLGSDALLYWVTTGASATVPGQASSSSSGGVSGGAGAQGPPGTPGVPGLAGYLTLPSAVIPADSSGNVLTGGYGIATGTFKVFSGTADVTSSCTFAVVANPSGLTTSISSAGVYSVTAGFGAGVNSAVVEYSATYQGATLVGNFALAKALQGGTGPSGSNVLTMALTNAAFSVYAYSNGVIPSLAGLSGLAKVYSGGSDVTATATFSAVASSGITGTVNTSANTPVSGQPIGYYQISAITAGTTSGTLTISATVSGTTLTQTFTISVIPTGIEAGASLPATNLFNGRVFFDTANGLLYKYDSTTASWKPLVNTGDLIGTLVDGQISAVSASKITGTLSDSQLAAIAAAKITGTIGSTQIANNAITTPLLAAGAVNTAALAAGAVTAATIAAGSITSTQIQAGGIAAANIAAGSLTATQMAAGSITGDRLVAGAITAAQIAAGTITSTQVAAGGITANNIDSRNLTIKDGTGTIIFGAGTSLSSSFITAATGWLNSNVSLNANGTLSGAGGGAVTLPGLGAGAFATLSQLTSGNVSTYIASAAIGAAYIGSVNANTITTGSLSADRITIDGVTLKSVAGTLQVGNLNASSITTGSLATSLLTIDGLTLTNSGGTLVIGAGGVGTGQIAANAVTHTNLVQMSTATHLGSPQAWTDLNGMSFTYTPDTTSDIQIDIIITFRSTDGNDAACYVRLMRDSTVLLTTPNSGSQPWMAKGSQTLSFSIKYVDTLHSTAARTYKLQGEWDGVRSGGDVCPTTTMAISEIKR
jgi:hypothetical protein